MSGLKPHTIQAIQGVFANHPVIEKAILYGSRAKGNYRNGSDIDITLIGEKITLSQLFKIETELDDLLLPYKMDVSIFHKIENDDLIEHIKRAGIIFYKKINCRSSMIAAKTHQKTDVIWMPEIPLHWKLGRVKSYFDFTDEIVGENFKDYKVLSLSIKGSGVIVRDMEGGGKFSLSMDKYQIIYPNSIVCCLYDMDVTPRIIGYCNHTGIITNSYTNIIPKENVFAKFYYYFLLQQDENKSLMAQGTGVRTTLTNNQFGAVKIPVPPYQEQVDIANHLDSQIEKIKTFINKKQTFIKLLKEQRQSVIDNAVTKGLDKNVEFKNTGIDWLGNIPEHWEVRKLKHCVLLNQNDISNVIDKNSLKKIALEHIDNWTGRFIETSTPDFQGEGNYFKKGDVLFNKLRPYLAKAFIAYEDGISVGELLIFTPNKEQYTSEFLFQRLMTSTFIDVVNSSTYGAKMPRASWSFIGNLKLPIPPKEEQTQIIKHIKTETSIIDQAISTAEKEIELIKEYQKAMIAEAVLGKIVVSG